MSLRFKASTSKYFLSFKALPRAFAPSGKIPLLESQTSVIYFVLSNTLATCLAPSGPMKLFDKYNSLRVECYWIALHRAMHPPTMVLLLVMSRTSKFFLLPRIPAIE